MTINEIIRLAQHIHDAEGYNLGDGSTREYRNAFWARVIGCVHFGHKVYNAHPDPHWHLKKASQTSPQSDDVVVLMPEKLFWDCIPGAGADGYRFEAHGPDVLDAPPQVIFAPPVPASGGEPPQPPQPPAMPPYPGDEVFDAFGKTYESDVKRAGQTLNEQSFRWAGRTIYDWLAKNEPTFDASIVKHRKEWCAVLGIPVQ